MALVYSTDGGDHCSGCGNAKTRCDCKNKVLGDGKVIISRSTKGRKGAGVTLITG